MVVGEGVTERLYIAVLGVVVALAAIALCLVVSLAETFLEEGGDVVGDPLEFFIALCLCGFETTGYMAANKGHRDCV